MAPLAICVIFIYALLLIHPTMVSSKRILMVTSQFVSHLMVMQEITSRLAERGHSITLLWAGDFQTFPLTRLINYTLLNIPMKMKQEEFMEISLGLLDAYAHQLKVAPLTNLGRIEWLEKLNNFVQVNRQRLLLEDYGEKITNVICDSVLSNDSLIARLRGQFDMAFVDDLHFSRCLYIIPGKLGAVLCIRSNHI
jgi:hypothetical protein